MMLTVYVLNDFENEKLRDGGGYRVICTIQGLNLDEFRTYLQYDIKIE